ncbi:MAG: zinc ribbon domain-containing protein [Acidobacteria bacterium]|nr:zinc ribbon domain-containing protein [Acidobacteriota bacterium]
MPIFEYRCRKCDQEFEKLVFRHTPAGEIRCTDCDSEDVEKLLSTFAFTGTTRKSGSGGSSSCGSCRGGSCSSCTCH